MIITAYLKAYIRIPDDDLDQTVPIQIGDIVSAEHNGLSFDCVVTAKNTDGSFQLDRVTPVAATIEQPALRCG